MRTRLTVLTAAALGAVAILTAAAGADANGNGNGHDSGGGGRLAFAIKDATGTPNIYSVRPDGNGLVRLTNAPAFDLCPDYSRDARQIAFCSNRSGTFEIWAMNADGTNVHQVTNGAGSFTFPDFAPNARKIVFGGTATASATSDDVFVVNADGTGLTQLTEQRRQQRLPRLLARREEDRVHQRPHRRRAGLGDERRRLAPDAAHA